MAMLCRAAKNSLRGTLPCCTAGVAEPVPCSSRCWFLTSCWKLSLPRLREGWLPQLLPGWDHHLLASIPIARSPRWPLRPGAPWSLSLTRWPPGSSLHSTRSSLPPPGLPCASELFFFLGPRPAICSFRDSLLRQPCGSSSGSSSRDIPFLQLPTCHSPVHPSMQPVVFRRVAGTSRTSLSSSGRPVHT